LLSKNNKGIFDAHLVLALVVVLVAGGILVWRISTTNRAPELTEEIPNNSFIFTAAGDFSSSEAASLVLDGIGSSQSDFTLALGDLGYGGNGAEEDWCVFTKERVGFAHPFEIIAGNHDDGTKDGDINEYIKCLPNRIESITGDYGIEYYFDYNEIARFILITPDITNYGFDYSRGSIHYKWLKNVIVEANVEGIDWIFLGMHKNCITPGVKSCEIGEDLINLAIEKGVDVILQGHEHGYFRSKQLLFNTLCQRMEVNVFNKHCVSGQGGNLNRGEGSVLVISGTGGYKLRNVNLNDPEIGYFEEWNGANIGQSYGYIRFNVDKDKVSAAFIPVGDGKYKDSFIINSQVGR